MDSTEELVIFSLNRGQLFSDAHSIDKTLISHSNLRNLVESGVKLLKGKPSPKTCSLLDVSPI